MLDLQLSTIIFQIINFLVLLAVLWRFLYRPVLRTMEQRQQAITARLREADQRAAQADTDRERLARLTEQARQEAEQMLATARGEAAAERQRLVESARDESARYRDEAQRSMQEWEREELVRLQYRIRETAMNVAGSLIREAAGPAVHQALVERLLESGIPGNGALRPASGHPGPSVHVELAYAPERELQDRFRSAFGGRGGDLTFSVNPDLIAGARILVAQQALVDLSLKRTLSDLSVEPVG